MTTTTEPEEFSATILARQTKAEEAFVHGDPRPARDPRSAEERHG
jgi:hypothetical protein